MLFLGAVAGLILLSCSVQTVAVVPQVPRGSAPTPTAESLEVPRIPVGSDRKVLQTLAANLDQDAAEEQLILLQSRSNLSLPVLVQVADYDVARKTYYLAWEGGALASASQPLTLVLEDLIGDHQQEVLIHGLDESGHPSLDVLRLVPPTGSLGFAYRTIFSRVSFGTIQIQQPLRPESYSGGQNSELSATIVIDELDAGSLTTGETVRTTFTWLFEKGEYVSTGVERYQKDTTGDGALEGVFSGDNTGLESFLAGPWVKAVPDKSGLLILFLDPSHREITFATNRAQEIYHWEVSNRASRGSLSLHGSNDLITLIKLQMNVAITAPDTVEINALDNPGWSGTYKRLDPTAARVLARQGTQALAQQTPPVGLYKNDKGDEFDFQVPEVRLSLGGETMSGSVAVFPLGEVTVLQIKVPQRSGTPGLSVAYSMVAKEESSTSRVVRTLRLQGGTLTSKGWVSDQSDPLRLEQVEGTAANSGR